MSRTTLEVESGLYKWPGGKEFPLIEKLTFNKGEKISFSRSVAELVFIMEGSFSMYFSTGRIDTITPGYMFFLPPKIDFTIYAHDNVTLIITRIEDCVSMCNQLSVLKAEHDTLPVSDNMNQILIKPVAELYIQSLCVFLEDGFDSRLFHEIKLKELSFILKNYYEKEELKQLFYPVLSKNYVFAHFILNNYEKVKTVKEFAALSRYSLSGFEKEFKRVFDVTPYQWMLEKKIQKIYNEIKYTNKPLKNVAEELGFPNLSQLCDFCRHHFDCSPGKIRKM